MVFSDMKELKEFHQAKNERIALAFGCFDLLHQGHIRFLQKVRQKTTLPIAVGVLDDALVRHMKGVRRPIRGERERVEVIDAIRYVDDTFLVSEIGDFSLYARRYHLSENEKELWSRCIYCLDFLRPQEFYYSTDFPITSAISEFLADCDIHATAISYTEGISTTLLAERLRGFD